MNRSETASDQSIPVRVHNRVVLTLIALCCLSIGIAIGAVVRPAANATAEDNRLSISNTQVSPDSLSAIFARVAKKVEPAVVYIKVYIGETLGREGAGSGVIVNPAGYVITNEHVISRASKIKVRLADGREFEAKVVGQDKETDLAVLRIDPVDSLPAAVMGDSDKLNVGDWVLAIGSPFGLEQTVTAGIISAKDRVADPRGQTAFQQFLQTDAAINPGNSGGPLVNLAGEVVGINSQILTSSGFYNGLGFALPSTTAVDIYNQIVTSGRVRRGFIGIELLDLTPQIARLNKLPDAQGALVRDVTNADSPAAKAGLQSGDVIIKVNGQKVKDRRDVIRRIGSLPVGSQATIIYVRNGVQQTALVKLDERKLGGDEPPARPPLIDPRDRKLPPAEPKPKAKPGLGISVETLTEQMARSRGYEGLRGAYVTRVEMGSLAAMEIFADDLIVEINYRPVATREDFEHIVAGLKVGDDVVIRVLRKGRYPLRNYVIVSLTVR
ncbi:MAG: trypsin-like peptidase domain-containing protein [Acidobacteriota bacterium]